MMLVLGLAVIVAFYVGRSVRKLWLPSLIGYMLVGIFLGVSCFGLFDEAALKGLSFIAEIGLGFVALMIGAELDISSLRRQGTAIVIMIFSESLLAFLAVSGAVFGLTGDLPMALVFGAMAPAIAERDQSNWIV